MAETLSLMEFLQALLADAELRGAFGDDPQDTLAAHGLADLTPADVHDALVLVQDNQTVDYSLDAAATAPPPPPPPAGDHEAAVEYLARYLDDPHHADPHHADPYQAGPDEHWQDPDSDAAPIPGAIGEDTPFDAFPADDTGYGAGSGSPSDDGVRAAAPEVDGSEDPVGHRHGFGIDEFGTDRFDAAEFGTSEFDLRDAPSREAFFDDDPGGLDPGDDGTALPEGA